MKVIYKRASSRSGVYKIYNTLNGRIYIGSTKEFKRRSKEHINLLKTNKHFNKFLQNDFNKYGTEAFVFEVITTIEDDKEKRFEVEQNYVNEYYDKQEKCYNFRKEVIQSARTCFSKSPEKTSKLISENMKLIWNDPELKEKRIKSIKESISTPEATKKLSDALKQSWSIDIERKQKQSERSKNLIKNGLLQKFHSKESKEKRTKSIKNTNIIKYNKLCQKQILEIKNFEYIGIHCKTIINANLFSPEGILYKNITNIQKFTELNNLDEKCIRKLIANKIISYNSWIRLFREEIPIRKSTIKYQFFSPGSSMLITVENISEFARNVKLNKGGFKDLISGRLKSYHGWRFINKIYLSI